MNQEVELGHMTKDDKCQDVSPQNTNDVNIVVNDGDDGSACVICLEHLDEEQSLHFHCGHVFHLHCILAWMYSLFDKNVDISCPICRSIECYSNTPYYNVMKVLVGYNEQHNNNVEVHGRHYIQQDNSNVNVLSSQQRIYYDNQQVIDDGLKKGFFRFMMIFTIIMVAFFCFLVFSFRNGR